MQGISLNQSVVKNLTPVFSSQASFSAPVQSKGDSFEILFGAKRDVPAPNTIEGSRYVNDRLTISNDVLNDLVATLDASMTVVGETYSGNEAFTTLYQVEFTPEGSNAVSAKQALDASFDSSVEFAEKNRMVTKSFAKDESGNELARSTATFVAVNPASVGPGKAMKTESVETLSIKHGEEERTLLANDWNKNLSGFYRNVSTRLGTRDADAIVEDLATAQSSDTRLINRSVYVTPNMLNKKNTGHGGVAAANAVKDMLGLANRLGEGSQIANLTASFQSPFYESDALQFDTTLDHVDDKNNLYFSTRIYRFDTKGFDEAKPEERNRTIEGPVILVHGKVSATDKTAQAARAAVSRKIGLHPASEEAKEWAKLLNA